MQVDGVRGGCAELREPHQKERVNSASEKRREALTSGQGVGGVNQETHMGTGPRHVPSLKKDRKVIGREAGAKRRGPRQISWVLERGMRGGGKR